MERDRDLLGGLPLREGVWLMSDRERFKTNQVQIARPEKVFNDIYTNVTPPPVVLLDAERERRREAR